MKITAETQPADLVSLPLYELASAIRRDWRGVNFAAVPYLGAMSGLDSVDGGGYGADSARSVVNYFLSNASTWRGPVAKLIKAELKRRVK